MSGLGGQGSLKVIGNSAIRRLLYRSNNAIFTYPTCIGGAAMRHGGSCILRI